MLSGEPWPALMSAVLSGPGPMSWKWHDFLQQQRGWWKVREGSKFSSLSFFRFFLWMIPPVWGSNTFVTDLPERTIFWWTSRCLPKTWPHHNRVGKLIAISYEPWISQSQMNVGHWLCPALVGIGRTIFCFRNFHVCTSFSRKKKISLHGSPCSVLLQGFWTEDVA